MMQPNQLRSKSIWINTSHLSGTGILKSIIWLTHLIFPFLSKNKKNSFCSIMSFPHYCDLLSSISFLREIFQRHTKHQMKPKAKWGWDSAYCRNNSYMPAYTTFSNSVLKKYFKIKIIDWVCSSQGDVVLPRYISGLTSGSWNRVVYPVAPAELSSFMESCWWQTYSYRAAPEQVPTHFQNRTIKIQNRKLWFT